MQCRVAISSKVAGAPRSSRIVCRPLRGALCRYKITLETPDGVREVQCDDSTYILDAAEAAGVEMPYSCRSGTCSTCAIRILSGDVDQSDQQMLDDDQIKKGFCLSCVAYPQSDIKAKTHVESELYA